MNPQGGMFGFQCEDRRADLRRQALMFLGRWREETGHPVLGESRRLPVEGPCGGTGLLSALRRRMTEEDDGTNQLVGELFGELGEQVQLLPVVGGIEA
jgi:hypothetical protein